ncbi:MFS transporter, DHA1 family, bicyclomycin/chloramphenicol resistance protein [Aliiroseovarius sediminilitoris]|uniref:MFS transporter, DHA1 family, bicyclomycin/chloramphenicol resistance protein n=1 Tax=Aliiroseovarius sediminilitoris TaxID=1173584 RepID=A0A1I0PUA8_9RHOB|nr:MFS transporter, DHA1 family, bicyclomycin/chloramphenicol resistance protein [Aliiroseovarius sediminilitoris]
MITRRISQHISPQTPLRLREYVLLIAALFSMVAFSIDSILPALPEIGAQLVPDNINKAQLLISAFVIGAGLGQLIFGPLSDSMGRRFSLSMGMLLYMVAAFAAFWAQSLEAILFWRFVQGLGAAGPRTCGMAMTRDLYEGRQMARVNSMAFGFFVFVPAVAPMIGQWIVLGFGWRQMFTAYILLAAAILTWFLVRQPETLPNERRRPLSLRPTLAAFKVVLQTRVTLIYMAIITLAFGQLMAFISSAQQIFVDVLGAGTNFPYYFALVTVFSAFSGFLNAQLVMRLGMRRLALAGFATQTVLASLTLLAWWWLAPQGAFALWLFCGWATTLFFLNGLSFGNLNALAIQPLGHVAGTASAVIGAVPTVAAIAIAAPIGLAFNNTPFPLLIGVTTCSALAWALMQLDRGNMS